MIEIFTLITIAIGLSMDTFSLSIIYGIIGLERKKAIRLSLIVGFFHFIMPIIGNGIGYNLINKLPIDPDLIVGIILMIIGIQMIVQKEEVLTLDRLISFIIFGITVSLDSFSVGIGLSAITNNYYIAYITFSLLSFLFTMIGLFFGKKLNKVVGDYSTKIGGILLIIIALSFVL